MFVFVYIGCNNWVCESSCPYYGSQSIYQVKCCLKHDNISKDELKKKMY